tara:strand:+ start:743 stop:982 length:240 start_codon:yes stop_codon:yes gene_type:complete
MNRILMIDPPSGHRYGFPKPVPETGTIYYGSKYDYGLQNDFKLLEWLVKEGYPQEEIDKCGDSFVYKYWTVANKSKKDT